MQELTQARLKEKLHYDPESGIFRWVHSGTEAGYIHTKGYRRIRVDYNLYYAHRLAFLYMTGKLPSEQVDHVNGTRSDNSWSNLRNATPEQNSLNRKGVSGVTKRGDSFESNIVSGGVLRYLGIFRTHREAVVAYILESLELHGDFSPYNLTGASHG